MNKTWNYWFYNLQNWKSSEILLFYTSRLLRSSLPLALGMGQRIRVKLRKLMGRGQGNLIGKTKAVHTSKAKLRIHSPLPVGRQVFHHLQESRAPSLLKVIWEDKYHPYECSTFCPSFPRFIHWAWHHMVWNIPLISWGQHSWLRRLAASCVPPPSSLLGCRERQKDLMLCKQQKLKNMCVF